MAFDHDVDDGEIEKLLANEEGKLAQLRELVDSACEEIRGGRLDRQEATVLAQRVRRQAQELIPDLMDRFDVIYKARFERLISQYIDGRGRGRDGR
ncbi:MAG: hypothetical protein FJY74_00595 [Candidatus Eisenbacteria bacterium]|nr:hypothetical protein [Candidatus Eisenbacteria bacterium]